MSDAETHAWLIELEDRITTTEKAIARIERIISPMMPMAFPSDKSPEEIQKVTDRLLKNIPPVDHNARVLTDGSPVTSDHRDLMPNGQQKDYVVLSEEERKKGFVRPVRYSYQHVGIPGPQFMPRDLSTEQAHYKDTFAKFEAYQPGSMKIGRYWTQEELDKVGRGCNQFTTMGIALAETYARDPKFYSATFCCGCGKHLPVGERGEFVWKGTNKRVGT